MGKYLKENKYKVIIFFLVVALIGIYMVNNYINEHKFIGVWQLETESDIDNVAVADKLIFIKSTDDLYQSQVDLLFNSVSGNILLIKVRTKSKTLEQVGVISIVPYYVKGNEFTAGSFKLKEGRYAYIDNKTNVLYIGQNKYIKVSDKPYF